MIYRTNCRCIASAPEPNWGDTRYRDMSFDEALAEFYHDHKEWRDEWADLCALHEAETGHRV